MYFGCRWNCASFKALIEMNGEYWIEIMRMSHNNKQKYFRSSISRKWWRRAHTFRCWAIFSTIFSIMRRAVCANHHFFRKGRVSYLSVACFFSMGSWPPCAYIIRLFLLPIWMLFLCQATVAIVWGIRSCLLVSVVLFNFKSKFIIKLFSIGWSDKAPDSRE